MRSIIYSIFNIDTILEAKREMEWRVDGFFSPVKRTPHPHARSPSYKPSKFALSFMLLV